MTNKKRFIELVEKEILTAEELQELNENAFGQSMENNGISGKNPDHTWYTVTDQDGNEYSVYTSNR